MGPNELGAGGPFSDEGLSLNPDDEAAGWSFEFLDLKEDPASIPDTLRITFAASESLCDFSSDGVCDVDDLNQLLSIGPISSGVDAEGNEQFDLNGDGTINAGDVTAWLSDAASKNGFTDSYLVGDANLDGTVNAADLNGLAVNWLQETLSWSSGDFNGDGTANAADLNAMAINWQQSVPTAAPVPEPSNSVFIWLGLVTLAIRCRGKRHSSSV